MDLIFRVFISSTFSDLVEERNALQRYVFPRLREYCQKHGARFQAIDLRWGVSEESALDQQTMNICIEELHRCQRTTPRPNFIVLLGQRYGWCPLPPQIDAEELETIFARLSEKDEQLIRSWYRRDDNAVPPEYVLQPREGVFEDHTVWTAEERGLRAILHEAITLLGWAVNDPRRIKYEASATHQEIIRGALNAKGDINHVFSFFRSIKRLPEDKSAEKYIDLDKNGRLDVDAQERLEKLKTQLLGRIPSQIHEYNSDWCDGEITTHHIGDLPNDQEVCKTMLEESFEPRNLCEAVWKYLGRVILEEIKLRDSSNVEDQEAIAHKSFGKDRSQVFVGRDDILRKISQYINGKDSVPLVIHGVSGSGKSALIAKAIEIKESMRSQRSGIIVRYIGTTPASSEIRSLLEGLCKEITMLYGGDVSTIPVEYSKLVNEFPIRMSLANSEKPLVLFIDALDQLSDSDNGRNLIWLPSQLQENVRLIVTTLPGESLTALEQKLSRHASDKTQFIEVIAMNEAEGKKLLSEWMKTAGRYLQQWEHPEIKIDSRGERDSGRRLTQEQESEVMGKFATCPYPLYLKLAFEEVRRWRSWISQNSSVNISSDISDMLTDMFSRLEDESNHGHTLVSRAMGYLVASRYGLTEDEMLDVLSADREVMSNFQERSPNSPKVEKLPVVVWARLFADIEAYMTQRQIEGTNVITFYHRQVRTAAAKRYLQTETQQLRLHRNLADYFDRQFLSRRKAIELPWQLRKSGDKGQLKQRLLDLALFLLIHNYSQNELLEYWIWLKEERTMGFQYRKVFEQWGTHEENFERNLLNEELVSSTLGNFLLFGGLHEDAEPHLRHALALSEWQQPYVSSKVAVKLNDLARLLQESDRLEEARDCFSRALELFENTYGRNHPSTATCLSNLGQVLMELGLTKDSENCFRLALSIDEELLGKNSPTVGRDLGNLALVLKETYRLAEAEQLYERALELCEHYLGQSHPETAIAMSNFALLLNAAKRNEEAELLARRGLVIMEQILGTNHPNVARGLNNLANVLIDLDHLNEAESLLRRSLSILEDTCGVEGSKLARDYLNNLGNCLHRLGKTEEAEVCLRRALSFWERDTGLDHHNSSTILSSLAVLLHKTGRQAESETLLRRALANDEAFFGPEHPRIALRLSNLGQLLVDIGQLNEAEKLLRRHLTIIEKIFHTEHEQVVESLQAIARVVRITKPESLPAVYSRILTIDEKRFGSQHPEIASDMLALAEAHKAIGESETAESLFRRSLHLLETLYGMDDKRLTSVLNHLGLLLQQDGRLVEAEDFLRRALTIDESSQDSNQIEIGFTLNNLSLVLIAQGKMKDAEVVVQQALDIFEAHATRDERGHCAALNNLSLVLFKTNRVNEAEIICRRSLEIAFREKRIGELWSSELALVVRNYSTLLETQGHSNAEVEFRLSSLVEKTISNGYKLRQPKNTIFKHRIAYLERGLWRQTFKLVHIGPGQAIACPTRVTIAASLIFDSVAYPDSLGSISRRMIQGNVGLHGKNRVPYEVPMKQILTFCPLDISSFIFVIDIMENLSLITQYSEGDDYCPGISVGNTLQLSVTNEGTIVPKIHFWETSKSYEDFLSLLKERLELDPDFVNKTGGETKHFRDEEYVQRVGFIDGCLRTAQRADCAPILKSTAILWPLLRDFFPDHWPSINLWRSLVSQLGNELITMEELIQIREDPRLQKIRAALSRTPPSKKLNELDVDTLCSRILNVLKEHRVNREPQNRTDCIVQLEDMNWPNKYVDNFPNKKEWLQQSGLPYSKDRNLLIFWANTEGKRVCIGYSLGYFDTF